MRGGTEKENCRIDIGEKYFFGERRVQRSLSMILRRGRGQEGELKIYEQYLYVMGGRYLILLKEIIASVSFNPYFEYVGERDLKLL